MRSSQVLAVHNRPTSLDKGPASVQKPNRLARLCAFWGVWGLLLLTFTASPGRLAAAEAKVEAAEKRLKDSIEFLAADDQEGRGVGTKGIDLVADYLAEQFASMGLNTKLYDGTPFQKFKMTVGVEMGDQNHLTLIDPKDAEKPIELKLGQDFTPMSLGGSGKLDAPLVFVGYGLTGKEEEYDDYAGINVEGKVVVVLRHEPQQNNPHSAFNGTKDSPLAPFWRKVSNAYEHGAVGVIFCTDEFDIRKQLDRRRKLFDESVEILVKTQADFAKKEKPSLTELDKHRARMDELARGIQSQSAKLAEEIDPLLKFQTAGGSGEPGRIPVVHFRRAVINRLLKESLDTDLGALEQQIDKGPTPKSVEIPGWKLTGEITVDRRETEVKNVIAVLEGEGPNADETVIVGAHYDHLGFGGDGSLAPEKDKREIHNGADDNGSGTVALVEVARILAAQPKKPGRRIVFIAFTGEERGLIGSARYCKEPLFPLDKTVAMLNMDMVGRLENEKLIIQGVDTAKEFGPLLDGLNDKLGYGFEISRKSGGFGPSDHSSFYSKQIPVMHYFTGLHKDYHRPSDDVEKINVPGMRRIAEMVAETASLLADAPARPTYVETKSTEPALGGGGDRPYFGSIPDFAGDGPGYAISGVSKDSPAEKGGLKGGDVIIKFGDSKIGGLEDFDSALRKYKQGDKVKVIVQRGKEEVTLDVNLFAPPK